MGTGATEAPEQAVSGQRMESHMPGPPSCAPHTHKAAACPSSSRPWPGRVWPEQPPGASPTLPASSDSGVGAGFRSHTREVAALPASSCPGEPHPDGELARWSGGPVEGQAPLWAPKAGAMTRRCEPAPPPHPPVAGV